ncbi:MAG: hypothetical protein JXA73_04140, partial [Acidobacteria bacterium]|nr:hypothetical protein [Acidobacteriota bacterium]
LGFVSQPLRGCLPGPPLSFQSQMYKLQRSRLKPRPTWFKACLIDLSFETVSYALGFAARHFQPRVACSGLPPK